MGRGSGGESLARKWTARLERWLGRGAVETSEGMVPAQPAGEACEAGAQMNTEDRGATTYTSTSEKRSCARCGRVLRWALPLCWDCDAAAKRAGAVERR